MFDIVKNLYQNDVLRPYIFGSLGTITGKNLIQEKFNELIVFFLISWFKIK